MKLKSLFVFYILLSTFLCANQKLERVSIQLKWFDQFQFAGYYIAKEKGFYEELGLDVEIKPFKYGLDIPRDVSQNKTNFAVGRENLILEHSKGREIVALYSLFQATPLVLLTLDESNINSIKDFKNRKIMLTSNDASEVSIKSMIQSNNVKFEELNSLKHSHKIEDLLNKKTDIISAYISKSPLTLEKLGVKYKVFDPKNYGFDMYSDFLYTNKYMIKNRLDAVKKFKKASLMGWEYVYSNIDESVNIIFEKYNSEKLSKEELQYEAKQLKKLSYFNTSVLGEIKEDKVKRIYDLYNIMGLIPNPVDLKDFIFQDEVDKSLSKEEISYIINNKVKVCISANRLPYESIDKNVPTGLTSEYLKYLKEKIGLVTKFIKTQNIDESLQLLEIKQCDLVPFLPIVKKTKDSFDFVDPKLETNLILATKIEQDFVSNLDALKGRKIAIVKSFVNEDLFKNKDIKFVEVENLDEALKKVSSNEVYGAFGFLDEVSYLIKMRYFGEIKIGGYFKEKENLSFALNKDNQILNSILQKGLATIDENTKQEFYSKWIALKFDPKNDYEMLIKIVLVFLIVLAFMYYRSYVLKKMNENLKRKVDLEVSRSMKKNRLIFHQNKMISMGEMIDNIAHQWRQPLAQINSITFSLATQIEDKEFDRHMLLRKLAEIESINKYMSNTIDDFRNFVKKNKKKEAFLLKDSILNSVKILVRVLKNDEIKVSVKGSNETLLYGHQSELQQVFLILINNSKDAFIEKNIEDKNIKIEFYEENENIIIDIVDNAGGIDGKNIRKIFKANFSTKNEDLGSGMGLYIAKMIIEDSFNGKVSAKNIDNGLLIRIVI